MPDGGERDGEAPVFLCKSDKKALQSPEKPAIIETTDENRTAHIISRGWRECFYGAAGSALLWVSQVGQLRAARGAFFMPGTQNKKGALL